MRRERVMTPATALVALVFLLTMGVPVASADAISFTLGTGNPAIAGYTGPYAQVDVDRTSTTTATITFTSLTNASNIYLLGDGGSVAINVNATGWTIGNLTGSNAGIGFTPGAYDWQKCTGGGQHQTCNPISGNEDGFGAFNQQIDSFDGFTHSSDTISFVLTNTSSTWASAGQVLVGNAGGNTAAAHIFVTSDPAEAANGALTTGYASNGTAVPDGGTTLMLFGGVFVCVETLRRRFRA